MNNPSPPDPNDTNRHNGYMLAVNLQPHNVAYNFADTSATQFATTFDHVPPDSAHGYNDGFHKHITG